MNVKTTSASTKQHKAPLQHQICSKCQHHPYAYNNSNQSISSLVPYLKIQQLHYDLLKRKKEKERKKERLILQPQQTDLTKTVPLARAVLSQSMKLQRWHPTECQKDFHLRKALA